MPQIKGVGELEWKFPDPVTVGEKGIALNLTLTPVVTGNHLEETVFFKEGLLPNGKSECDLLMLIAQEMSVLYPTGTVSLGHRKGSAVYEITLNGMREIERPTHFITCLAEKLSKWVLEYQQWKYPTPKDQVDAIHWCEKRMTELGASDPNYAFFDKTRTHVAKKEIFVYTSGAGIAAHSVRYYARAWRAHARSIKNS
jgi:hypothetical protein